MAQRKRKPAKPAKTRVRTIVKKVPAKRRSTGSRKKDFMGELMPVLLAVGGAVGSSVVSKQIPLNVPNADKIKAGAMLAGSVLLASKAKSSTVKSLLGGVAVGSGLALVKSFAPTLLSGEDDLLGYYGNYNQDALTYQGLNALENLGGIENLAGDDDNEYMNEDLYGDEETDYADFSNSYSL